MLKVEVGVVLKRVPAPAKAVWCRLELGCTAETSSSFQEGHMEEVGENQGGLQ